MPRILTPRTAAAIAAWLALNAAVWSSLFQPLPHVSSSAALTLAAAATIGVGLLGGAGRWSRSPWRCR